MIKQTSLDFLSKLKLNNSKKWFEQNRNVYENYRSDIMQLTENILKELLKIYTAIALKFISNFYTLGRLKMFEDRILMPHLGKAPALRFNT